MLSKLDGLPSSTRGDHSGAWRQVRPEDLAALVVAIAILIVGVSDGGYQEAFVAGLALVVWWTIGLGLALGVLPRGPIGRSALIASLLLLGLTLFTFLSIWWATDNGHAFAEGVRAAALLGVFLLALLCSPRGSARVWLKGLALGLLGIALLALASRVDPNIGHDREISSQLEFVEGRLSYPFGYWNALAASMAMATGLAVWFGALGETRLGRAVATAAVPLPLLAIYLCNSRGGFLAAIAMVAIMVALGPKRTRLLATLALGGAGALALIGLTSGWDALVHARDVSAAYSQGRELGAAIAIVAALLGAATYLLDAGLGAIRLPRVPARLAVPAAIAVALVALVAIDPQHQWEEFKAAPAAGNSAVESGAINSNGNGRYQFWSSAVAAFEHQPLRGIGAGGFETWFAQRGGITYAVRDPHSLPLGALAELGLIGFGLLTCFWIVAFASGWRRRRGGDGASAALIALAAAGLIAASLDWSWKFPLVSAVSLIAAAALVGPATVFAAADERALLGSLSGRRRLALTLVGICACGLALWASGVHFVSQLHLSASRDAAANGELALAAEEASRAVDAEPWAAEPRVQLALAEEKRGDLPAALVAIRGANERALWNGSYWFVRSRVGLRLGRLDEAQHSLESARALSPYSPIFSISGFYE